MSSVSAEYLENKKLDLWTGVENMVAHLYTHQRKTFKMVLEKDGDNQRQVIEAITSPEIIDLDLC